VAVLLELAAAREPLRSHAPFAAGDRAPCSDATRGELLGAYDKGEDSSPRRQQAEIALARARLRDWQRRQALGERD
jgi:hypothetical protein